ncbi:MAG: Beta-ketoacyl synthase, partial [Rhodospirillales bacterium]|nr:Beta-ketoacyl synthase [Rhodospirillales bacterium]
MNREIWITGIGRGPSLGEGRAAHWAALNGGAEAVVDTRTSAPYPVHPLPALNLDA